MELIIYLSLILFISSLFTFAVYELYNSVDPKRLEFDKIEKSLQVGVSVAGFLSLIITVKLYRDSDKRQAQQTSIILFDKFRDDKFDEIRGRAWKVREKYRNDKKYKIDFIKAAFSAKPDLEEIEDELDKVKKAKRIKDTALKKDIKSIRDLMEFYHNLIIFKDVPEALIERRYFYYGWWRSFLYEMATLHDEYYIYDQDLEADENFDYQQYKKNISYVDKLRQIDDMFGFTGVNIKKQFHKYS